MPRHTASGLPRLRVTNGGSVPASALAVLFPRDEIEFGDVLPGATTGYRTVPNGAGEEPMEGSSFTYTITVNPNPPGALIVELLGVAKDE